jgi:hypothetical protein
MNVDDERHLLHEICRNSSMGVEAIDQVLKNVYDEEFAYELNVEANRMRQFERRAKMRLEEHADEPSEPKPIEKTMLKTAIRMKTALGNETDKIARMMQKGNQKGVEELKNAVHKYKDAGIFATELAKDMMDFEEENERKLKSYLKD